MTVKTLTDLKKEFFKTYYSISSGKVLLDLIFTDYKNSPTELKKIPSLEFIAKTRVSQLIDATKIPVNVVEDFFETLQEIIIIEPTELASIQAEITAAQAAATSIDPIEGTTGAAGGDGGGGDGGGDGGGGGD